MKTMPAVAEIITLNTASEVARKVHASVKEVQWVVSERRIKPAAFADGIPIFDSLGVSRIRYECNVLAARRACVDERPNL